MGFEERVTTFITCDKCGNETTSPGNTWPDDWFLVDIYDYKLSFDDYFYLKKEFEPEEVVLCPECAETYYYKKYLGEIAASTWFYTDEGGVE